VDNAYRASWRPLNGGRFNLPDLTPSAYAESMAQSPEPPCRAAARPQPVEAVPEAVLVERGKLALRMYVCHACHAIPDITGPQPHVGPPLAGFAGGQLIAGRFANTRANLVAWIRHPQRIDPRTAMPDLAVSQAHAEEMAAYLWTLTSPP
jgi:cytochrome c1